jgi:hypothetical protein
MGSAVDLDGFWNSILKEADPESVFRKQFIARFAAHGVPTFMEAPTKESAILSLASRAWSTEGAVIQSPMCHQSSADLLALLGEKCCFFSCQRRIVPSYSYTFLHSIPEEADSVLVGSEWGGFFGYGIGPPPAPELPEQ